MFDCCIFEVLATVLKTVLTAERTVTFYTPRNISSCTSCTDEKIGSRGLHMALRIGCDVLMVLFSSSKLFNHNYTMKNLQR